MTYKETLDFLYSQLPMFQRVGAAAFKKDLRNTLALCEACGNPQLKFKSIHIAGTNGKGSCSHMLASIFQKAGYKTGLYTSPHLVDFRERMRINGEMIPEQAVIDFVQKHKELISALNPSFFEMTVALCFDYFAKEEVDIAIIETGLGGRLDSTNVITPELSLITNISFDHMDLLGDTLAAIASEKAGIIKPAVPVVVGESHPETAAVFNARAAELNSPLLFADKVFSIIKKDESPEGISFDVLRDNVLLYEDMFLDLPGDYQTKNLVSVYGSLQQLIALGYELSEEEIKEGLADVKGQTGLRGRWQQISFEPRIIVDTAHNEAGIKYVVKQLSRQNFRQLHIVLGMVKEKDQSKILKLLPSNARYYFCKPAIPRGLDEMDLKAKASEFKLEGNAYASVGEALNAAKNGAGEEDLIFVGGSTFVVAEAI